MHLFTMTHSSPRMDYSRIEIHLSIFGNETCMRMDRRDLHIMRSAYALHENNALKNKETREDRIFGILLAQ
jgi:hypothetical protein